MKIPYLKPCPFCAGKADMVKGKKIAERTSWYKVFCIACQNRTWGHPMKKDAVAAWNKRNL